MINACLPSLPPSWIVYLPSLPSLISWPYARAFGAIYHHGLLRSAGRCNEAHSRTLLLRKQQLSLSQRRIPLSLALRFPRHFLVVRNYQEYHLHH